MDGIARPLRLARERLDAAASSCGDADGVRVSLTTLAAAILTVETRITSSRAPLERLLRDDPEQAGDGTVLEADRGIRMDLHLALGALQDDVWRLTDALRGGCAEAPLAPVFDLVCGLGEQTECWRNWLTEDPVSLGRSGAE